MYPYIIFPSVDQKTLIYNSAKSSSKKNRKIKIKPQQTFYNQGQYQGQFQHTPA